MSVRDLASPPKQLDRVRFLLKFGSGNLTAVEQIPLVTERVSVAAALYYSRGVRFESLQEHRIF